MRKEAVRVTPGDIIAPGQGPTPEGTQGRAQQPAKAKHGPARPNAAVAATGQQEGRTLAGGEPARGDPADTTPAEEAPAAEDAAAGAAEPGATRRNFFRLDVFDVSVRFELEAIGDQSPEPLTLRGSLADVSAGGLRLVANADAGPMPNWPVQSGIIGRLQFGLLEDEPAFSLPGRLVRRIETTTGYELAFSWDEPPQPEIDRLVHDLYQLEVRRRASIPDNRRPKKPQRSAARQRTGHRQPALLGASLGLAVAIAVYETVAVPAVTPVLGMTAVVLAAAYFLLGD